MGTTDCLSPAHSPCTRWPAIQLDTIPRPAPLLQGLASWGRQQGHTWAVDSPAGPASLTPLHLAAAARDGPLMKALFGELQLGLGSRAGQSRVMCLACALQVQH